jgi:hypothetical protein
MGNPSHRPSDSRTLKSTLRGRVSARVIARNMHVCRRCGELTGLFSDPEAEGTERLQKCSCRLESMGPGMRAKWPGYDFNTAVEICQCCAADIMVTGTLDSPFFCEACIPWIQSFNESVRETSIPMSRRATMDSGVGLLGAITRLQGFRRERVLEALERAFNPDQDVFALGFLEAQQEIARFATFTMLTELFRSRRSTRP